MTHDSKELPPLEVQVQEARYAMFRLLRTLAPRALLKEQWAKLETLLDTPAPQSTTSQQSADAVKQSFDSYCLNAGVGR